ncbi:MAG: YdcF family protein [Patescibacteria group bacterium]|jgi:hypothetical protein
MSFWQWLEKRLVTADDPLPRGSAVIIGVGIDVSAAGNSASPYSKAVVSKCRQLFDAAAGHRIIFTDGYFKPRATSITEARGMAHYLSITSEVPRENVDLDLLANRTYLNADYTLPMLEHWENCVIVVAQQWHARRVRATFRKRWAGSGIDIRVIKAWSDYGGGSQKRLDHFWSFFLWDSLAFVISKLKGYC